MENSSKMNEEKFESSVSAVLCSLTWTMPQHRTQSIAVIVTFMNRIEAKKFFHNLKNMIFSRHRKKQRLKKKCQISATIPYLVATQQNNGFSIETSIVANLLLRGKLKNRQKTEPANNLPFREF